MNLTHRISSLFLSLCMASTAVALDFNYADDEAGILDKLSAPAPKASGQGYHRKSLWGAVRAEPEAVEVKSIQIRDGAEQVTRSFVPVKRDEGFVNLKIQFDYDSAAIRPESIPLLDTLGRSLSNERLRGKPFSINGHTDADGSETYNLHLSVRRAKAVEHYLLANFDLDSSRLRVVGYGEGLPLVPNSTPENKQINRRVEIERLEATGD